MGQLRNFLLLGILSTLIDFALYSLLVTVGVDYVFAIVAGYGAGLASNYVIGRRYIFTDGSKMQTSHGEFTAVALIAVAGALLNIAIVKLLSYSLWQFDPLLSRAAAIGIVFFWNFGARKLWVYH